MLWLVNNEIDNFDKDVENVIEKVKSKILEAIKHHVKKGYKNRRIVMNNQHSYHVTCKYDVYVLDKALTIISEKFSEYNIPIAIEYSEELDSFFKADNSYFGEKDIPIIFNILR